MESLVNVFVVANLFLVSILSEDMMKFTCMTLSCNQDFFIIYYTFALHLARGFSFFLQGRIVIFQGDSVSTEISVAQSLMFNYWNLF